MAHEPHPTQQKITVVQELVQQFQQAKGIYLADFSGLNVEEVNQLRRKFHEQTAIYRVVKNTLIEHACEELGYKDLILHLQGPTALAFSLNDPTIPVKIITDFAKEKEKSSLVIKAGMMENVFVSPADVEMVKRIPPREVLLQQILFVLESPVANLVGVLSETLRTFLAVLDAIIQQKQGGELPPVSEVSEEPVVAN